MGIFLNQGTQPKGWLKGQTAYLQTGISSIEKTDVRHLHFMYIDETKTVINTLM